LPNVQEKAEQKNGVTYKTTKSFCRFNFKKNSINLLLRSPKYDDPKKLVKDVSSFLYWGYKGLVKIDKESDVDYIFSLIKQSYEETL
jgi:predicted transport protein